jgi:O-antigen ligase
MTAPISSGMARFAAVPGIISFLLILQSRGAKRYLSIGFFIYAGFLIYLMQSRGAIFAYGFALSFVLLFYSCRTRLFGLTFLVIFALTLFTNVIPESVIHGVTDYLYRGQSEEEFVTFTGRTFAWKLAWNEVHDYPILGQGFHSDHYLLGLNIHNTYMYTLMSAGYIGAVAFIIGVATAWYMLLYNLKSSAAEQLGHRVFLLQVGGILAFFTVRSIPEVSGAIVGIDTMIMLSAITYIGILYRYQRQLAYQERIQQNKAVVKYKIRWQRSS